MAKSRARRPSRPLPPEERVGEALARLAQAGALQTLVRGALPTSLLRRLLKDAMPRRVASEVPEEAWSALAAGIAAESPVFGIPLAHALHDRLAWDREPGPAEWPRLGAERPLEALWMAALSEDKAVRKAFPRTAADALRAYRASPACAPPSWDFVDAMRDLHARSMDQLRDAERSLEDAERRFEAERHRAEELREELKRLRRENSDLRAERAQAEKKAAAALEKAAPTADPGRLDDLERRLRKADKENEHLRRELERARSAPSAGTGPAPAPVPGPPEPPPSVEAIVSDPNPRRRVLRQVLRKMFKKGKIGASHTHVDNVYRGVVDHEKGIAKEAVDLLAREGLLLAKPTAADTHVSLNPDRTGEIRAIIAGAIESRRLLHFIEGDRG